VRKNDPSLRLSSSSSSLNVTVTLVPMDTSVSSGPGVLVPTMGGVLSIGG